MNNGMETISRVLINRKEENELLRHWCDEAAGKGGCFSIEHKWMQSDWYTEYTICWPTGADVPIALSKSGNAGKQE